MRVHVCVCPRECGHVCMCVFVFECVHLSDLLNLAPSLPDEGATLTGGDDEPQRDRRLGADRPIGHQCGQILGADREAELVNIAALVTYIERLI